MKFSILHLSDIHFQENEKDNTILEKVKILFDSVKNRFLDSKIIFLIVSGDIAFSGKQNEYLIAEKFINELKSDIENYCKINCEIILIPGNHDCFFEKDTIRDAVIKSLESDGFCSLDEKQVDICCAPQNNYLSFEEKLSTKTLTSIYNHKLLKILEYKAPDFSLIFNCFNTSWISKVKEEFGKMVYPANFIDDNIYNNPAQLTFNIIHHPINWQSPIASREFKKILEKVGDIVLSGHDHEKGSQINYDLDKKFTGYIEAPALQEIHKKDLSGFSIINFDLSSSKYKILRLTQKNDQYILEFESPDVVYQPRYLKGSSTLFLDASFAKELDSPGAQFIHTQVEHIYLSDIFVFPYLKDISSDNSKKESLNNIINSEQIFIIPKDEQNIRNIWIGNDFSGKTTLCKKLFSFYYEKGFIPILINGDEIKEISKDKFRKYLKEIFLKQYDKRYTDTFDTIDNKRFVLIIDDFQNCNIKNQYKLHLIDNLKEVYKHLIFFGNASVYFEPFIVKDKQMKDVFLDFEQYTILELGIKGRNKLINKWIRLGRESYIDNNELLKKVDYAEKQIQDTLGKGFMPSYPIFILTLLQSIETGISNPEYSLYGHYYEFLINDSIIKNVTDKTYHQFYHQFLTEYCYYLFDEKLKEISKDDFRRYYDLHQKTYTTKISFESFYNTLCKAKFINERDSHVSISYKYIYYYYVARYFARNISDGTIRNKITQMCKRLHREEFVNILIFLTHLSQDPLILSEIHNTTDELLKDIPITKLEDDIEYINKLIENIPQLVLQNTSIEETREEDLKDREEVERIEKEFENKKNEDYDLNEDISSIDTLSILIMSIKSFELLGQITKKYWGSIKGDKKLEYSESTCNLALRTLNFYFKCIIDNKDSVIEWIKLLVDRKKIKDTLKIQEFSKKFIFHLSFISSYGIIKRVSNSIGHIELADTYKVLLERNSNNAYKLIDFSIKLDSLYSFPYKDMGIIWDDKEIRKNHLAKFLIQNMVYSYIHLYNLSFDDRQRICSKLGIEVKKQITSHQQSVIKME